MSSKNSLLSGIKILEEVESPINGKITVLKSLAFGTYIQVEGLTQSGGVMHGVWKRSLKKARKIKPKVRNCLILGLGGGSAASLVKKFWPEAEITGIEIDPIMVDLGRKYLALSEVSVEIKDAYEFCKKTAKGGKKYDLILVDTYIGYEYPRKFERKSFLELVLKLLTSEGLAVFNRLYFDEKRAQAMKFGKKLEKVFSKVETIFPEANIMFVCS